MATEKPPGFDALAKRSPVEIRDAHGALLRRGSVASLAQHLGAGLAEGNYGVTVTLPGGEQVVHPVTLQGGGQSELDELAQRIRESFEPFSTDRRKWHRESTCTGDSPAFFLSLFSGVLNGTHDSALGGDTGSDGELRVARQRVSVRNRGMTPMTIQVVQLLCRPLNIVVPPGCTVIVRAGPGPVRSRLITRFGEDLADELIELRADGLLSEASGVVETLTAADVLAMAQEQQHPSAAIAAAYIMLRGERLAAAVEAIDALAACLPPVPDLLVLQAESRARRGDHVAAQQLFMRAADCALPTISTGLSYLVDRLRMYMQAESGPAAQDIQSRLVKLQRVAARCDFNLVFTNYTGASPATPGDEVVDEAAPLPPFTLQVAACGKHKEGVMTTQYVTQEQMDELVKVLASSDLEAMGAEDFKKKFCQVWPSFEQGLQALQGILAMVPGVSVFAGPAIGIVRAAGTAASQAVCEVKP